MKRVLFVLGLAASLFYLSADQNWGGRRARAAAGRAAGQASAELRHQVRAGRGADRVQVIIQPVAGWSTELDDVLHANGASNIRRFDCPLAPVRKMGLRVCSVCRIKPYV